MCYALAFEADSGDVDPDMPCVFFFLTIVSFFWKFTFFLLGRPLQPLPLLEHPLQPRQQRLSFRKGMRQYYVPPEL